MAFAGTVMAPSPNFSLQFALCNTKKHFPWTQAKSSSEFQYDNRKQGKSLFDNREYFSNNTMTNFSFPRSVAAISKFASQYDLVSEREIQAEKNFMEMLMEKSNTYIQWPSRMKIGAKTKKDLFVRIYGHNQDDVNEAKGSVLSELGPHRDLRITLKMEISYTDHSHLIGCRGATIRRVMEDTGCHIHFPDSNRMSKDHKSNQVTIAGGSIHAVEQARSRVRDLSPLIFQFTLPLMHASYEMQMNPDAYHIFIENIQTSYNVQVTIHPPNKLQQTTVSVKGCEVDAPRIKEAITKIINYFAPGNMVTAITLESTMEISAVQHSFVRAVNDSNVHGIMMNTGAKVIFPDLSDNNIQQIKRSRVYIAGEINSVYYARQQLIGCLPLRMIFDLADDFQLDWEAVRQIGSELNVNVKLINRNRVTNGGPGSSLPPPIPGRSRTIQLIAAERNTGNIYEARRRILGCIDAPSIANVPTAYALRPTFPQGGGFQFGNRTNMGPLPPLMLPPSPNMVSPVLSPSFWPPTPFNSPFCSPPITTCVMPPNTSNVDLSGGKISLGHVGNVQNASVRYSTEVNLKPAPQGMDNCCPVAHNPPASMNMGIMMKPEGVESGDFAQHRKAPGWERSNTNPNIIVHAPGEHGTSANGNPSSEDSTNPTTPGGTTEKINNPMSDKKYMAMKAMYQSKIGSQPRVPNSEWAGYGFSKTHLSLFPKETHDASNNNSTSADTSNNDDGLSNSSTASSWVDSSTSSDIYTSSTNIDKVAQSSSSNDTNNNKSQKDGHAIHKQPLGPQQSNLLDFAASRPVPDIQPIDVPSLFIQNGLEKYIDTFVSEEIDLESFSSLTEGDLRSLGVSSYPARKKMLLLIARLACSESDQIWK